MERVLKFPLTGTPGLQFTVSLPYDAKVLHVSAQDGVPMMWALCRVGDLDTPRTFLILATGQNAENVEYMDLVYVETFHVDWTVWHVFEVRARL